MIAALLHGRTHLNFQEFRQQNHLSCFLHVLGLLELLQPHVFRSEHQGALWDCLLSFIRLLLVCAPAARRRAPFHSLCPGPSPPPPPGEGLGGPLQPRPRPGHLPWGPAPTLGSPCLLPLVCLGVHVLQKPSPDPPCCSLRVACATSSPSSIWACAPDGRVHTLTGHAGHPRARDATVIGSGGSLAVEPVP